MEQKSVDRYTPNKNYNNDEKVVIINNDTSKIPSKNLDDYDNIQMGASTKIVKKGGITEWGDI
jgi:hypothetical protein